MFINKKVFKNDVRSGRFICLIVMLILGSFSITTTSLLARSDKRTEIEDELTLFGDYDEIIYDTEIGFEDSLSNLDFVDEIGLYYELGTVSDVNEQESFKAVAFKNESSEEIYHQTCFRGDYPSNDNEIAIDISVSNRFGIAPYPGETIDLKMYNSNGDYIGIKSFVISGVFKSSNNDVYGGWGRCPLFGANLYQMPAVFFSPSYCELFSCEKETVFFRADSLDENGIRSEISVLLRETGHTCVGFENNSRRCFAYVFKVGLGQYLIGDFTWDRMNDALDNGLYKKDFYSEFIIPIISILVVVTEAVSVFMLTRNIIADRKERYAIFRCLGLSSKQIVGDLLADVLGVGLVSVISGIILGYGVHIILIRLLNKYLHLRMYDGIHADNIVKQITYNPIIASLVVCALAMICALIVPVYRLYKMYPTELLSTAADAFVGVKKGNSIKAFKINKGWLSLLNRRIDLHDWSTMLVMIIVLSSSLLGYVFFRAFSDQATVESKAYMEMLGVDGNGYVVSRSPDIKNWDYNIVNQHNLGIAVAFPEAIESSPDVRDSWSVIFNDSTRMVFDEEPDSNIQLLLGNRLMNYRYSDDPLVEDSIVAEGIIFEHMGYAPNVFMYELPTVGLTTNEFIELEDEVVSGEINLDRIRSGEEIVLAVPEELKDLCLQYYPVGTTISFDDVVLSSEEDSLDFATLNDYRWVVYDNYVETEYGETYVSYGAFGTRYEIEASVGAIVVLHNNNEISEYLTSGSIFVKMMHSIAPLDSFDPEPVCGMSILCLPDSFISWGLPDRMFTSVKVELNDNCDIYQFDRFWYGALSGSKGVQTKSTFDYLDDISIGTNRVMTIFFVLITMLILLGMIAIVADLYTKTRSNSARFQTLRRVGLSVKQASLMIYSQNMYYPIIATIVAIIPVYIIQFAIKLELKKLDMGGWDMLDAPWRIKIPYWADLFSYDFIPAVICCLILGYLLIFIATLPQILYLRKMKMIETRED